jgi:ribosomal protein S26
MPREKYTRCRNCGRAKKDAGVMSHTQLCPRCSKALLADNIVQMEARSGPNFTKWRHGMIRCAGGVVVDTRATTT